MAEATLHVAIRLVPRFGSFNQTQNVDARVAAALKRSLFVNRHGDPVVNLTDGVQAPLTVNAVGKPFVKVHFLLGHDTPKILVG